MKVTSFRYLISTQAASVAATIVISLYENQVASTQVAAAQAIYYAQFSDSWVFKSYSLNLTILGVFMFLAIAAWTGLFLFKPWGRVLSLCATALYLINSAAGVATISLPFENALVTTSTLLWGAVLATAYWSPVSAEFRVRQ